jgi:Cupredoxin-like domain
MRRRTVCMSLVLAVVAGLLGGPAFPVAAQAPAEVRLVMLKDKFDPSELKVKAGTRFILVITNKDDITHEIDIPKLRIEKKVRAGQVLKLQMPALKPGKYELADDDSTPELHGVIVAE